MSNLLIGEHSQLAHFWPKDNTIIISSRNIDLNHIKSQQWDKIYFAFSEGRTYLNDDFLFYQSNVVYPSGLVLELKDCCNKIVFFSTMELWNKSSGEIVLPKKQKEIIDSFSFIPTPYINSKYEITKYMLEEYPDKVIVVFPFQFSSPLRSHSRNFLMTKVYDSIIERKKVEVGNLGLYRELLHPKFVIKQLQETKEDCIIGSGRLIYVRDFVRKLYDAFDMDMEEYVIENENFEHVTSQRNKCGCYLKSKKCLYSEANLLSDTIKDLETIIRRRYD